jgi:hypothetical protein
VNPARACLLLLALTGLVAAAVWLAPSGRETDQVNRPPSAPSGRSTGAVALAVLHAWDADRAAAYGAGSPERLRGLYVAGSGAGRADLDLLRRYHRRGLRVTGMRTQVLSLAVLEHRTGLWRLRITDRLVGAVAVGDGGRMLLPRDRPSEHEVTLMRGEGGRWRVAGVRAPR